MTKRTTVEIDEELLARAKDALSLRTTRETIEESLRRVVADDESEANSRAKKQVAYLDKLAVLVDLDVLQSDEMWQ